MMQNLLFSDALPFGIKDKREHSRILTKSIQKLIFILKIKFFDNLSLMSSEQNSSGEVANERI